MQPTPITDVAPGTAAGILGDMLAAEVSGLKGHVTVELIDELSGRVVDRIESDNYVNVAQWQRFAKAMQRLAWTWALSPGTITLDDHGRDPRLVPTLRNETLVCWDDTTAETSADLFAFGNVIAWAHRWSQGSPSLRQGLVNPSLCTLAPTSIAWTFEWTTTNGNGTFQSVGWRRLYWSASSGDPVVYDMPNFSRRVLSSPSFTNTIGAATNPVSTVAGVGFNDQPLYYNSADGKIYAVLDALTGNRKLVSVPVTIDANGNYTLGVTVDESANAIATGVGGNNVTLATFCTFGLTRLGSSGDWIAVGGTGIVGSARRPFVRRVTAAGVLSYTNANAGTFAAESALLDCCYDGTNLWAISYTTTTSRIHRIDPATGTVSATIATITGLPSQVPTFNAISTAMCGLEWDPVNSWLWVMTLGGYIFNVDTSGNWMGVLLSATDAASISLTSPQSGATPTDTQARSYRDVDSTNVGLGGSAGGTTTNPLSQLVLSDLTPASAATNNKLFTMDGDCFAGITSPTGVTAANIAVISGASFTHDPNFASRTLLGAPAVKANTQTMRIKYTMTLT